MPLLRIQLWFFSAFLRERAPQVADIRDRMRCGTRLACLWCPLTSDRQGSLTISGVASIMADNRRAAGIDHMALGLFLLGLLVSVAVFSFDQESHGAPGPGNLLGEPGDWLAGELYQ